MSDQRKKLDEGLKSKPPLPPPKITQPIPTPPPNPSPPKADK